MAPNRGPEGTATPDSPGPAERGRPAGHARTRREFVGGAVGASLAALAGCAGGAGPGVERTTDEEPPGDGETTAGGGDAAGELPPGVSADEFARGPVPEPYRTATSQGGEQRDPDDLRTKEAVRFQEADDAVEAGFITPGPDCGNCAEYVPDQNGDGFGACAEVEGYIGPDDWCVIWRPTRGAGSGT